VRAGKGSGRGSGKSDDSPASTSRTWDCWFAMARLASGLLAGGQLGILQSGIGPGGTAIAGIATCAEGRGWRCFEFPTQWPTTRSADTIANESIPVAARFTKPMTCPPSEWASSAVGTVAESHQSGNTACGAVDPNLFVLRHFESPFQVPAEGSAAARTEPSRQPTYRGSHFPRRTAVSHGVRLD
jgi:hypothetical protein